MFMPGQSWAEESQPKKAGAGVLAEVACLGAGTGCGPPLLLGDRNHAEMRQEPMRPALPAEAEAQRSLTCTARG